MRKDEAEYRRELLVVAEQLRPSVETLEIRGSGLTQYVYARQGANFVELSWDPEGIWVQLWNPDSEFERHERSFPSYALAVQAASRWLLTETLADPT